MPVDRKAETKFGLARAMQADGVPLPKHTQAALDAEEKEFDERDRMEKENEGQTGL
jgi:hypothetical protein